jgi:hypothetical protein
VIVVIVVVVAWKEEERWGKRVRDWSGAYRESEL